MSTNDLPRLPFDTRVTGYLLTAADVWACAEEGVDADGKDFFREASRHAQTYDIIKNEIDLMTVGVLEMAEELKRYTRESIRDGMKENVEQDSRYIEISTEFNNRLENLENMRGGLKTYVQGVTQNLDYIYYYIQQKIDKIYEFSKKGDALSQQETINQMRDGLWTGVFGISSQRIEEYLPQDAIENANAAWDNMMDKFCSCWRIGEEIQNMPQDASKEDYQHKVEQLDDAKRGLSLSVSRELDSAIENARTLLPPAEELERSYSAECVPA